MRVPLAWLADLVGELQRPQQRVGVLQAALETGVGLDAPLQLAPAGVSAGGPLAMPVYRRRPTI